MLTKQGVITSAKMQDTVTVTVHRQVMHKLYRKRFRVSKNFLADSKGFDLAEGDLVEITECKPLSKRKRFKVTQVIKQAPRVSELGTEAAVEKAMNREKIAPQKKSPASPGSPDSPASSSI